MKKIQLLHDNWQMKPADETAWLPATVPGTVFTDLIANGKAPADPYWRDNDKEFVYIIDNDFEYHAVFDVDPALFACNKILLRCNGLDTLATLTLNGQPVGEANNQHRVWEYDVKSALKETGNELTVFFPSCIDYITKKQAEVELAYGADGVAGSPHVRKIHSSFGWDWGARFPDAGIWRDIMLLGYDTARIDNVYIAQDHHDGKVDLTVRVDNEIVDADAALSYTMAITAPDGGKTVYENSPTLITVDQPLLWWPNGYGEQYLYGVEVTLTAGEQVLDSWNKKIGLRTMAVRRDTDEYGRGFAHEVNGVKIFAMGANYIPEDDILSRLSPARSRRLLEDCKLANFNIVRVWGGGYYPDDYFYDACDELGILVWQDFMFACSSYDLTEEFEENIRGEITGVVRRLRHHPCIALWCGNNEIEDGIGICKTMKQRADYIKIFEYIFPNILKKEDPQRFYWPSSPSSGGSFEAPNAVSKPDGDMHYWEVWHGNVPFTEYRKHVFHYASEYGFQSFPAYKTIESFTLPEDRNIFSYVMEKHQRNGTANGKIMFYLSETYRYPGDFETLVYASQMLQGQAIRYGVEHWRRFRGISMGSIYWQLNDCFPVASWASLDYYGRWKALHYFAKRFYAPLLVSCCEESTLTQGINANTLKNDMEKSVRLSAANETREDQRVTVSWALRDPAANILESESTDLTVPALTSVWLDKREFPQADVFNQYVSFEMKRGDEIVSSGTVLFCPPKHFHFLDPHLSFTLDGNTITVTADSYVQGVALFNENEDMVLSDNFFDMNAGTKTVKILRGDPVGLKIKSVYDIR